MRISGSVEGGTRQPNGAGQSLDPWSGLCTQGEMELNLSELFRLHEKVITITFTVRNTGAIDGTEVWDIASRCKEPHRPIVPDSSAVHYASCIGKYGTDEPERIRQHSSCCR